MGRAPCCSKVGLHRGSWTAREDTLLTKYIQAHGEGHWRSLPKKAGLLRCGKSCRLRWMNYLRPDIKRGNITEDEDDLIIRLHSLLGNRWSLIAGRLPGRTDNEIKNYWNTHLSKKLRSQGTDPTTHKKIPPDSTTNTKKKRRNTTTTTTRTSNNGGGDAGKTGKAVVRKTKNQENNGEGDEKHKVHLPKPVRVTSLLSMSRNNSFDSASTTSFVAVGGGNSEMLPWPNCLIRDGDQGDGGGIDFFIGDDQAGHDLVTGCCSELEQQQSPPTANSLQKLYEEYLELLEREDGTTQLELDSFSESLLV